ncbi:MAG: hypothetical protein NTX00_02155 [Candidatus Parcubacteria bacterium]|nr:hypothetical protein [Candidatus Parcubacteria bacterium]
MTPLEKARKYLEENKELFQFLKGQPAGQPIEMPEELVRAITVEHFKNVSGPLREIELARAESLANAHNTAPKVYC